MVLFNLILTVSFSFKSFKLAFRYTAWLITRLRFLLQTCRERYTLWMTLEMLLFPKSRKKKPVKNSLLVNCIMFSISKFSLGMWSPQWIWAARLFWNSFSIRLETGAAYRLNTMTILRWWTFISLAHLRLEEFYQQEGWRVSVRPRMRDAWRLSGS